MTKIKDYQERIKKGLGKRKVLRLALMFVGSFMALIIILFVVYSLIFQDKAYLGFRLGVQKISGQNQDAVTKIIKSQNQHFQTEKIDINAPDKNYQISVAEIALSYNEVESAKKAATLYHGNTWVDYWKRLKTLFRPEKVVPIYSYNQDVVKEKLKIFASELDKPEKDYGLKISSGQVEITTELETGKRVNQDQFIADFQNRLVSFSSQAISLSIEVKNPSVTLANAEEAKAKVEAILAGKELTLSNQDKTYLIDIDTLSNWIVAVPKGDDLIVDIDRNKLKDHLGTVASSINIGPQDAMLSVSGGKVIIAQASRDGRTVEIETTAARIATILLSRIHSQVGTVLSDVVPIEVKITKPEVTSENLSSLGLTDLIGSGTTSFLTSPTNRISNITVGARLLNGVLIKPGDIFSTLARLGKIDATSGFLPELVIKENRTVPEFGGGLCQVSTTLFRAALNSGLKITERQNHRYRVSYYEPPVGMDATIYEPAPDFKFQNDTPGYILVQSKIVNKKITFDFYGTKDGRIISLSNSVISDITAPPEPLMEPTDTLPIGETKQVERAHDGANASFVYTVTRNGETLHKVTFTSHYTPWQARILVGTGPVAPAPTPPPEALPVAPATPVVPAI